MCALTYLEIETAYNSSHGISIEQHKNGYLTENEDKAFSINPIQRPERERKRERGREGGRGEREREREGGREKERAGRRGRERERERLFTWWHVVLFTKLVIEAKTI